MGRGRVSHSSRAEEGGSCYNRGSMGDSNRSSCEEGPPHQGRGSSHHGGLGVGRDSLIAHVSHIAIHVISGVGDSLGPAVRESHLVGATLGTQAVRALGGSEGGARVVVTHGVVEVVGGDLGKGVTCSVGSGVSNSYGTVGNS